MSRRIEWVAGVPTLDGQALATGDRVLLRLASGEGLICRVQWSESMGRRLALELRAERVGGGMLPITLWAPADAALDWAPPRMPSGGPITDEGGAYVGR